MPNKVVKGDRYVALFLTVQAKKCHVSTCTCADGLIRIEHGISVAVACKM